MSKFNFLISLTYIYTMPNKKHHYPFLYYSIYMLGWFKRNLFDVRSFGYTKVGHQKCFKVNQSISYIWSTFVIRDHVGLYILIEKQ